MNSTTIKVSVLLAFFSFIITPAFSQEGIDELLQEGKRDGEYLMRGYITPLMTSLSLGVNQGWYNTAKPHKIAGFDLTFTASAMYVPTKDLYYHVDNSRLNQIELLSGEDGEPQSGRVPTVFGPDDAPHYRLTETGDEFEGPGGIDLKKELGKNWLPVPMATLGFGLPKNTDVKVRFAPTIDLGDETSFKIFGLGVMHDIKQHIPGIKLLPFDLSAFVGYTTMSVRSDLSESDYEGENQHGIYKVSSTTIQAIISKKLSVVTFYGSVGYNIAKSNLAIKGTYDFNEDSQIDQSNNEVNPLDMKFKASGFRGTAGMRLKLAIFTLHADYTLQKYNALTVGFGFNVR